MQRALDPADRADESPGLLERVEWLRLEAARRLSGSSRADLGQFLTPAPVAQFMASMLNCDAPDIHLLDPGAGVGSLFAAVVADLCQRQDRPRRISVTASEIDPHLAAYLPATFDLCREECRRAGIEFDGELQQADFIARAAEMLKPGLFSVPRRLAFNCAILNPPYRKIHTDSDERYLFRRIGIETTNLYTGFLAATIRLLEPDGEFVSITPRSFCNGPYFRSFRKLLLSNASIRRIHVFESRDQAFRDGAVLQENIIVHAVKTREESAGVLITSSSAADDEVISVRQLAYSDVVKQSDAELFIHISTDTTDQRVSESMRLLNSSLADLDLSVSTGRVVDFRAAEFLRSQPEPQTVPLIYPAHLSKGAVTWPRGRTSKPSALLECEQTRSLLIPNETYVLVKRFTSKEERKRVVAVVFEAGCVPGASVGFENHLNYFHQNGSGLDLDLARGLAAFLNSTLVDTYFRQFNGHTQVNATDLRNLRYPSKAQLRAIGARKDVSIADQATLDTIVTQELFGMNGQESDALNVKRRIQETLGILRALGLPREQQNERSALTLLALLDLAPDTPWSSASNPLRGITPMMAFFAQHYGKTYAPNTRETVRRFTVHQFLQAGLIVMNPDNPDRPVNSPNVVYQIENGVFELLRSFGSSEWEQNLRAYLASVQTLQSRYA